VRALVVGAAGQLGRELVTLLGADVAWAGDRVEIDVTDGGAVSSLLDRVRPDVVFNVTAYNRVDAAEAEPGAAFAVNSVAPYLLARASHDVDALLVHYSTDYVFDGTAARPYREDDAPHPLGVYGASKLAGEKLIAAFAPRHFVLRSTGLYGVAGASGKGGNFVETMLRLGKAGPVRVVDDQVMTPTATVDLAAATAALLAREGEARVPYGVYHLTSAGQCSWFHFARTIFELCGMDVELTPITTAQSGSKARRPAYSPLDHGKWMAAGFAELRPWGAALGDYLQAKGHI
jgi:dTDP-4-dehydrorhamnose reductase